MNTYTLADTKLALGALNTVGILTLLPNKPSLTPLP
jgi:hypothetical protein